MITLIYGVFVFVLSVIIYLIYKRVTVIEKFHEDATDPPYHNHVTDNTGYIACIPESQSCGTNDVCCTGLVCNGTCQTSDDICRNDSNYSTWDTITCVDWSCDLTSNPNSQTRTLNGGIDVNCDPYLTTQCTNQCSPVRVVDFEYDLYFKANKDVKIVIKSITTDIGLTSLDNFRLYMKLVNDGAIHHYVDDIRLTGTINSNTITLSPYIEMLYNFDTNFIDFLEGSYTLKMSFDNNPDNGFEKNLALNHITDIYFTEPDYKQNLDTGVTQNADTNRFIKITGFETRDPLSNIEQCSMKVRVFKEEGVGVDGVSLLEDLDQDKFVTDQPIRVKSSQTSTVDTEIQITSGYLMTDIVVPHTTNLNRYTANGGDNTLYIQLPERKQYRIDFHLVYNGFVLVRRVYTLHIDARGCEDNGEGCAFSGCCASASYICTTNWSSSTVSSPTCKTENEICANDNNFDWAACSWTCDNARSSQTGTLKSGINANCSNKTRDCPSECTPASALNTNIKIHVEDKNNTMNKKCLHKEGSTNNVGLTNCSYNYCNHNWQIIAAPNDYYQIKYKGGTGDICENNVNQCLDYDTGDCDGTENTYCGAFEVYDCDASRDAQLFRFVDGSPKLTSSAAGTHSTKIQRKNHDYLEYDTGEAGSPNFWGSDDDSNDGSLFHFVRN